MSLVKIQNELKAPKSKFNKFGGFHYRSAEDIQAAVKPLLQKYNLNLTISDCIEEIGGRVYVKSICILQKESGEVVADVAAYARETEEKKGMDVSQITGSASSYARKYALAGMFLCDDVPDADSKEEQKESKLGMLKGFLKKADSQEKVDRMAEWWKKQELDPDELDAGLKLIEEAKK